MQTLIAAKLNARVANTLKTLRPLIAIATFLVTGCCADRHDASEPRPSTAPAPTTRPVRQATFRIAEPRDLRATLIIRPNPKNHFPLAIVQVYNGAADDVIVEYEPGCVAMHCGEYEQAGPAAAFVSRREVLRPSEPIEFELPAGGWRRSPSAASRELLIPSELPKGTYPVWATFRLAGPGGGLVETAHDTFVVR